MSKRSFVTNITPLPRTITRETAIALLHDHRSMIELNPLVVRHEPTDPPRNASKDEAEDGTWYEITDQINYLPGGAMKSQISYKACFYNLPLGLQTHVFAPAGLDMKAKWLVGGNMPGEPREPREMGVDTPREGLYIREDVDMRCNVFLTNFVKRNLKKSHQVVVDKIVAKAGRAEELRSCSKDAIHQREGTSTIEDATLFSRAPFVLSHLVSAPSSLATPGYYWHQEQASGTRFSSPLYCDCEGTVHTSSCSFFHPLNQQSAGLGLSVSTQHQNSVHTSPSPSLSSCYSRPCSPARGGATSGSYSSIGADQYLLTNAVHHGSCSSYLGLRHHFESEVGEHYAPPEVISGPSESVPNPKSPLPYAPQLHVLRTGQPFRPHLNGEQTELPSTTQLPHADQGVDETLVPSPLRSQWYSPQPLGPHSEARYDTNPAQ